MRRHLGRRSRALRPHLDYMEGERCPLDQARIQPGQQADQSPDRVRAADTKDGIPLALEAYAGNTGDPTTFGDQVEKLQKRSPGSR